MSMKKSSDTIGNRTRELPVCSAVPQPLRHRVPHILGVMQDNAADGEADHNLPPIAEIKNEQN
jgi:hypothetical protein